MLRLKRPAEEQNLSAEAPTTLRLTIVNCFPRLTSSKMKLVGARAYGLAANILKPRIGRTTNGGIDGGHQGT